ncbi:hypothetical protein CFOL_v3_16968 [Cephalotus follicularis]|uniref:Uncharacterized protein n=1 Tax=Cephalotus follicularis TaxID=3775 RepID=A0A1Q3C0C9_CEPFO|nr:hypothetical protein CFOL_v3_16968 [Cephalotus follicularis]
MGANEFKHEPTVHEDLQDFDEEEETLSLCDLATDGYEPDWEDSSREERQSSSFDQDLFEFFSEDFTATFGDITYPSDNIIFCGKLITHKKPLIHDHEKPYILETTNKQEKTKKTSIFQWKTYSFNKSRSSTSSMSKDIPKEKKYNKPLSILAVPDGYRHNNDNTKGSDKFDFSVKDSMLATPVESRWYLFAFGMGRFPVGMEDIKTRKRKKSPAPAEMILRSDGDKEVVKHRERREKGLWGLLNRVLGCKSQHATAIGITKTSSKKV